MFLATEHARKGVTPRDTKTTKNTHTASNRTEHAN
jgi:hypothetical protein